MKILKINKNCKLFLFLISLSILKSYSQTGASLDFDGSNDYVAVSSASNIPIGNSLYTIEAWIKPTAAGAKGIIGWGPWGSGNQTNAFRLNGSQLVNYWWGNDLNANPSPINLLDGNWHHVAATFDGTTRKIYVDGILKASDTPSGHNVPNANNLRIGSTNNGEYFTGGLDEIRVWNIARTQCELQNNMNCEINSPLLGLVANYHFNQGAAGGNNTTVTSLIDASGNNNNGTITNLSLTGSTSNFLSSAAVPSGFSCSTFSGSSINITGQATICAGQSTTLTATAGTYTWSTGLNTPSIVVTPAGTTSYTLTTINPAACSGTIGVITITVNPVPVISINSGSICTGKSFTMSASGATSYTYSGGSAVVSPTTNTSYTVTGTTSGCTNTAISSVTVNANPVVAVNSGSICSGSTFTMNPTGASTYTYSSGSSNVSPTTNTSYTVTGTSTLGCINTAISSVTVNPSPSLNISGTSTICSGNTATLSASTSTASGPSNAIILDGVDDYLIGNVSGTTLTEFTIEAYIKPDALAQSTKGIMQWANNIGDGAPFALFQQNSSTMDVYVNAGYNLSVPLVLNSWNHIALSYSSSVYKLYLNGSLITTYNGGLALQANANKLYLGNGYNGYWKGNMDEVRVWNVARTQPQISSTYSVSVPSSSPGLMVYYQFNEFSGTTTANNSIGVNTLTLTNGPTWQIPSTAPILTNTVSVSSFAWSTGGTTSSILVTPTVTTTYSVVGTSSNGCSGNTSVYTVSVNTLPTVAVNSGSICNGSSFTMIPSGAATYAYTGGSATVSPSSTTTYTVTGTSSAGCSNTAVSTVTVNANPTVAVNSGAICNGSSFTMIPSGASTYAYTGGSATVSPTTNTNYTVTGTNALGCSNTAVATVTVNANPTVAVNSGSICNGSSFTMNPTGALSYVYSSGSVLVSPSTTTTYSVTGTNAVGCTNTALSTVTVNAIPTIVIPPTGVCTGGTATLTPTGAASYTYSGGSAIVTPPSNTTYTITGTSTAGCIGSAVTTVSVSGSLIFAVNSGSICTGKSFTMTPSGAATYTYSSGSPVVSPTTNTTYTVTGASAAGCLGTAIASVTVNVNPTVAVNSGSICNGSSFIMNPTGAATYVYTGGSATVSPTTNTNYTVTGTSALGCTNTAVSNVTVNANPVLTVNSGSLCSGNNFTFTPTGAISYTYSSGSAVVTPTATTDYTVTGSNAFGCTSSSVKTITVSITPVINVSSGAVCTGGSWTITPTGAATYTYSSGSAVVTPTAATTDYTVSGSNIDGCQSLAVITITVNPTLLFSPNSGSVCIGSTFTMSPTGALSYTYSSGTALVTPTTTTTYTIIAVNSVGCLGEDYCTVTVNALPTLTVNSGAICTGQSFTIVPTGASTYTYSSGSDVVNPLATTDYSVTGTDANGCVTATDAISTVTVNALPTVTAATDFTLICVGEVANLTAGGATTYAWNTSATTASTSVTPTTTTTYSVDGTDGNGCVNTANVTVNVNDCVGIQQLSSAKLNVSVYPNPTTGLVTLDLNAVTQVTVTNAFGQVVYTETVLAGKQTIDLKNQNNGLYFMNLNQNGKQQTIKVIKN